MGLISAFALVVTVLVHHLLERPMAFVLHKAIDYMEKGLSRRRSRPAPLEQVAS